MNIRFSGITEFSGPESKVQKHLDALQESDVSTLTANSDFHGGRAVALTGKDSERFMKEVFDCEMPEEFKGVSKDKAGEIIMSDPDKYQTLINKLTEMASDVFGFLDKVFQYVDARKAEGKDADGNPIKQESL